MRAAVVRSVSVGGLVGAAAGVLVALAGNWWAMRHLPNYFGWYSPTPLPDDRSVDVGTDWWQLLWPAVLVGVVVGVVTALALSLLRRDGTPARPWLPPLQLGVAGAVLGLAVATALYLRSRVGATVGLPRRYVDYLPTSRSAYRSSLTIAFDDPDNVWTFFVVCAASGVLAGLVGGAVVTLARRR